MQDNAVQATPQLLFVALKYIVNENKLTLKLKLIDFRRRPYKSDWLIHHWDNQKFEVGFQPGFHIKCMWYVSLYSCKGVLRHSRHLWVVDVNIWWTQWLVNVKALNLVISNSKDRSLPNDDWTEDKQWRIILVTTKTDRCWSPLWCGRKWRLSGWTVVFDFWALVLRNQPWAAVDLRLNQLQR